MTLETPPSTEWCQRWRGGRASWRHPSEGGFDRSCYEAAPLSEAEAKAYVLRNHYAGSYPAAHARYGLWRGDQLVGAAVLAVPVNTAVLTGVFPGLVPMEESTTLGRFVLDDSVESNGETFFLGRVWRMAAQEGYRGVVSFADPMPRRDAAGSLVVPGHTGTIYQAANSSYLGRGTARRLCVLPDGTTLNDRSAQKVRRQERGHDHVEARLCALGAKPLQAGGDPTHWLRQAQLQVGARWVRHAGNHRYCFVIGRSRTERRQVALAMAPQPYPKSLDLDATSAAA